MGLRPELQTGSDSYMRMLARWSAVCCGIVLGPDLQRCVFTFSDICFL